MVQTRDGREGGRGGDEKRADSGSVLGVTRQPWVWMGCSRLEVHCPGGSNWRRQRAMEEKPLANPETPSTTV